MRFLVDSMLPPDTVERLVELGHEGVRPVDLGAHNLPDDTLIDIAATDELVIVTENAADFHAATCAVVFVRKRWWPGGGLDHQLAEGLHRWATANPNPGPWPRWLGKTYR